MNDHTIRELAMLDEDRIGPAAAAELARRAAIAETERDRHGLGCPAGAGVGDCDETHPHPIDGRHAGLARDCPVCLAESDAPAGAGDDVEAYRG